MSFTRLGGVQAGRLGYFSGQLSLMPAEVIRAVAAEAEGLGYGTHWFGEALGRETFAHAGLVLSATERTVVASGIANIHARDPMAARNGARTVAEAWPDRFILGLGVSHAGLVQARGSEYGRPLTAMRDYLTAMDQVPPWRGGVTPPEAPVVLAALGPRMAALAAERTAGVYPYFTTTAHVAGMRAQLGPEPFIAADLPVVLAGDREKARQIGDRHMRIYLNTANYRNNLLRLGWPETDLEVPGSESLFDAIVAWGDEAAVAGRARALWAAGADQVVLNIVTGDRDRPYLDELRRLAFLAAEAR